MFTGCPKQSTVSLSDSSTYTRILCTRSIASWLPLQSWKWCLQLQHGTLLACQKSLVLDSIYRLFWRPSLGKRHLTVNKIYCCGLWIMEITLWSTCFNCTVLRMFLNSFELLPNCAISQGVLLLLGQAWQCLCLLPFFPTGLHEARVLLALL